MSAAATAPKMPEALFRLASLFLVAAGAAEEEAAVEGDAVEGEAALLVESPLLALQAASILLGTSIP